MNRKAIWIIIGLMTAALLGTIVLQMYWISESIRQNESKFDTDVFDALNRVAAKVQANEPYVSFTSIEQYAKYTNLSPAEKENSVGKVLENLTGKSDIKIESKFHQLYGDNDCNCAECTYRRQSNLIEYLVVEQTLQPKPIEERINNARLKEFIHDELENEGINIPVEYGVYSKAKDSYVIFNEHYIVPEFDSGGTSTAPVEKQIDLEDSKFKVQLFSQDLNSPGHLKIHFPAKASVVWGSVWKALLASILFTGIILFCFAYTIQVIFRQKKVSEMKTDFINNMTHEFKTPIATISLAADSITSPMVSGNEDKIKRFASIIKQENKRMLSQVEKVLQMAKIDKKEFKLNIVEVNTHEIIEQAVQNIRLQVEPKGGNVSTKLEATRPMIQADLTHFSNIVNNLLDNANKYSPKEPEISVITRNVSNGIEVIVKDNGIGMSKEAQKHIFNKFYRVHTGNLHDVKGFGLGLSYVKALVTAHNGHVDVKTELGKGSSFILFFPYTHNSG